MNIRRKSLILVGALLVLVLAFLAAGGISTLVASSPSDDDQVKIAVVQFRPARSKDENLSRMANYLKLAGERGADLVVFPELTTTYYPWADLAEAADYYRKNAEAIPEGKTTQLIASLAKKYGMYVSWGMAEQVPGSDKLYNSQVLVGPDGTVIGVYRKIHLVPGIEEAIFTPGDRIEIYDTAIGKIGIMICYDRRFPELARTYSLMGAELILVPAATTDRFVDQFILSTRAYENSVWLVFANQVGSQPGGFPGMMHGDSRVIDPDGGTRAQASGDKEEILWLPVGRSELEKTRDLLERRRPEVYAKAPIIYPPTKEGVVKFVIAAVLHYRIEGKELYITPEPLPPGTVVRSWTAEVRRLSSWEWLVFIDDRPEANWEHPCRYVFVDNTTWEYVVIDGQSPPRELELEKVARDAFDAYSPVTPLPSRPSGPR